MTRPTRQRNSARKTIFVIMLFALETMLRRRWIVKSAPPRRRTDRVVELVPDDEYEPRAERRSHETHPRPEGHAAPYSIGDGVRDEYGRWHASVWKMSDMELRPTNWTPPAAGGDRDHRHHPGGDRSDRFPSVDERARYYMGTWYDATVPMYGRRFEVATFVQRKTTREYGPYANVLVNLYNLDRYELSKCHENKMEMKVFSPYCRDYTDIAILHSGGSANVLHYIGDGLPIVPEEIGRDYPLFAKVRPLCDVGGAGGEFMNRPACQRQEDDGVRPILLPLNRKRHFGAASTVPENDVPWESKVGRAVWRGKFGNVRNSSTHTNDIKFALVSKHLNSTTVDAKFSKNAKGAPRHFVGSYMSMKDQLAHKYIISIEGNDVSSGLKWMLLSNSVVLTPSFTMESWSMEGMLKPFVHYIPLKADMSNVEEMIRWAELHPTETRLISERSTLFVYDAFFHPDAIEDEEKIMVRIMERYEQNFGHDDRMRRRCALMTQSNKIPSERAHRFPSVKERVKYLMGEWYHNKNSISMQRTKLQSVPLSSLNNSISRDSLFIASGHHLSACAMANNTYSKDIRELCQSSLQHFDERNTADLKSSSFDRLRKSKMGATIRLAPKSSWTHDGGNAKKDSKRVILDDTIKIICNGDCSREGVHFPYFASYRRNNDAIIWPFNVDSDDAYIMVKSGVIDNLDRDFESKTPTAVIIGGLVPSSSLTQTTSETAGAGSIGVRKIPFTVNESSPKKNNQIRDMLSHRYLVASDGVDGINGDLVWMLLSKSLVLMPGKQQVASSWLMESFLKPYVHFVPIAPDYSDVHEKISWCEDNLEKARSISERATLYVHDMFLDRRSEKENEEVTFQVMERYSKIFS